MTASVQPLLEHALDTGLTESERVRRAWDLYDTPEVRFACRQYSNAFSSAKLTLGRRSVMWEDPSPILEPSTKAEAKAYELLLSFAGGPEGQQELLDRMGTYFIVPGDMALVGAFDPARMAEDKMAKWDVWSTTEVKWDGTQLRVQTSMQEDHWQVVPDYIKHVRVWNRHPRRGWESDSPVMSALTVLELIGLYDDRMTAEALSRLIGAGVWMLPQGMSLPSVTGERAESPSDFLQLMKQVASLAIKDRRSPAASLPILVEAAAEDIEAASKGHMTFSTPFDERTGELQNKAIARWAVGVDLPMESMLGLAQATHWNASLITVDKVQSFVVPSLRRAVGNLTRGWLRPALAQFGLADPGIELWFDPSGIQTRVDLASEAQWAKDRFMLSEKDTKEATGLSQTGVPGDDDLKRQMLLHMARRKPEFVPYVLQELGIEVSTPDLVSMASTGGGGGGDGEDPEDPDSPAEGGGRQGPQEDQDTDSPPEQSGRSANLRTTGR